MAEEVASYGARRGGGGGCGGGVEAAAPASRRVGGGGGSSGGASGAGEVTGCHESFRWSFAKVKGGEHLIEWTVAWAVGK